MDQSHGGQLVLWPKSQSAEWTAGQINLWPDGPTAEPAVQHPDNEYDNTSGRLAVLGLLKKGFFFWYSAVPTAGQ